MCRIILPESSHSTSQSRTAGASQGIIKYIYVYQADQDDKMTRRPQWVAETCGMDGHDPDQPTNNQHVTGPDRNAGLDNNHGVFHD